MSLGNIEDIAIKSSRGGQRSLLARILDAVRLGWLIPNKSGQYSMAFTSALVALAAKMAKADGVAVASEWEAFDRFLDVPAGERANIKRLYDQAKQDTSGASVYAARIAKMLDGDAQLKRDVIECLLYVACADGVLHPEEDKFVRDTAVAFGFSKAEFRSVRAMFVRDEDSPYEVLGLPPDATDAEIKSRYRKLVGEVHPDRLTGSRAPAAIVKAANAKLAAINAAHDAIMKERGRGGHT